ncbi:MAG TPA: late competence development ComFB family protein [Epulopiscium sp.]|nr:late competence development ComFB family protein [Candidatus Epulonipiscium sp.]
MFELKNYMELLVDQAFDMATQDMDICKCDKCRLDIMAIALNSLKPMYVVADDTYLYVKLNTLKQQFSTDIVTAITKGSMVVSANERHEK